MELKLTGHVKLERKLNCFLRLTLAIVLAKDYTGFRNRGGKKVKVRRRVSKMMTIATKVKLCESEINCGIGSLAIDILAFLFQRFLFKNA